MAGIYIHIPFCKQACFYCDFHFSTSIKKKEQIIFSLKKELEIRREELKDKVIETIYFGGGTPSLLSVLEIESLLLSVYENYVVCREPEITLEANPDDLSEEKIKALANTPINRLSIGIQSFFDADLQLMNRAHTAIEAKNTLTLATNYFKNISVDLIYGIPGCTNKQWLQNIEIILQSGINHVSSYALTVEPNTALHNFIKKGVFKTVDEKQAQQQFYLLKEKLQEANFVNYELSNFGKENYFSKNNSAYWLGKPYLGIGPSAHSFNGFQRSWNVSNNAIYSNKIQNNILPIERETLSKTDLYNEYIMTGLRTIWGVSLEKVTKDFGDKYYKYIHKQAKKHIHQELLYIENKTLKTTLKGQFLSDGIASDLFMLNPN